MNYEVGFTGSSGNAVLIDHILFDIGISYKNDIMKDMISRCHAIFISHKHGDHLNMSTYKYIAKFYPMIPIFGNDETIDHIIETSRKSNHNDLYRFHDHDKIKIDHDTIQIYKTKHDSHVCSTAYAGITSGLESFVFATDFYDWNDLPQGKYDYIFVEANHDENYAWYLKQIEELGGPSLAPWILKSTGRHTTKQDALKYFELHKKNQNSKFIPLHKSSRFYNMDDYRQRIDEMLSQEENEQ